ncbi:30S ribosomal protein S3 [symbiont of Argiope bruennichi]|uniref:30S ribosomal protein S3 n=1 Tax=symbiont of Argiope bruennichi TaxID=2810479 RepID=UPI003DA64168
MGQKVNPTSFRIGSLINWKSNWIVDKKTIGKFLVLDKKIRRFIINFLPRFIVSSIEITRSDNLLDIVIYTTAIGLLIGKEKKNLIALENGLKKLDNSKKINVIPRPIKNPAIDAQSIANFIASQIENRQSFRVVQKSAIRKALKSGVYGIKTSVSGRLNGADIARTEKYQFGILPLHTISSDISFAKSIAKTTYGIIGVKVEFVKVLKEN